MVPPKKSKIAIPKPTMDFWIKDGEDYKANKELLIKALFDSPNSEIIMRRKMGKAFEKLEQLFNGDSVSAWAAQTIEYGLDGTPLPGLPKDNPSMYPKRGGG